MNKSAIITRQDYSGDPLFQELVGHYQRGDINKYFFDIISNNWHLFNLPKRPNDISSKEAKEFAIKRAISASKKKVESEEESIFLGIVDQHDIDLRNFVKEYFPSLPDIKYEDVVNQAVLDFREKIEAEKKLDKPIPSTVTLTHGLFQAIHDAAKKVYERYPYAKQAYPITGGIYLPSKEPYHVENWIRATKDIYTRAQEQQIPLDQAMQEIIGKWDKMEQMDYKNWLKFYRERVPEKYPKLAGRFYESETPGYFVPNFDSLKATVNKPLRDEEEPRPKEPTADKREKVEIQRAKIVGRLSAAEKMLASMDGQLFAGDDQELMLKLLQDLKRKVQTANKISIRSSLFEDLIIKEANYIRMGGNEKVADWFVALAQEDPMAGLMAPPGGGLPADKEKTEEVFRELQAAVKGEELPEDKEEAAPAFPVPPPPPPPAPPKKASLIDADADIIVEAQAIPEPMGPATTDAPPRPAPKPSFEAAPGTPVHAPPPPSEDIVVGDEPAAATQTVVPTDDTDDIIGAALKNLTIQDVINRLEMLASIYKKRDIARQLSILDIMLDRLGIGSFFPILGEAMAKALESNQYISSRIEDVLLALKGSVKNPEADKMLEPQTQVKRPDVAAVARNLEDQEKAEDRRKELRKQRDEERLTNPQPPPGKEFAAGPPAEIKKAPVPVALR